MIVLIDRGYLPLSFIQEREIFGGGGRNRTAVPKQPDKSRYMLSLSFKLNLSRSGKQDQLSSSLFESHSSLKG